MLQNAERIDPPKKLLSAIKKMGGKYAHIVVVRQKRSRNYPYTKVVHGRCKNKIADRPYLAKKLCTGKEGCLRIAKAAPSWLVV